MEFGIFHEFPSIAGQPDSAAFDQAFELVDGAERWGLDALWLAELHFDPARAVLSSPLCVASAIAARTKRMKIGIAVQVLPLCHPLRLAEEAATVDQLSRGRLIFGVGRSGVAATYEAYGVPYAESRDRFAEVLDIVQLAWTQERVSYEGRFYRFANVRVTPRPFQQPMPDIRVAATSPDTFVSIGKQGKPIFVAVRYETADEIVPLVNAYRAAYREAGHPGAGQVFLRVPAYIAATDKRARAEAEASFMHFFRQQANLLADSAKRAGVDGADRRAATAARLQAMSYEDALAGTVLVGSPEAVSDKLDGLQAQLGLDGVLMELNCGGKITHTQVKSALKLLCQQVMPRFH
ncbi:MAG TPA: LLM class flavin-dependent oxidoreductase [Acetobacteraceae bacterium]|jgi:alkanesulfonate monooxygenase SsuD/methylene tetrahydromethanopterin reductase-like flavin-dependent oxidoreductase (luciferase family)|nr:LLM class flavin-dependent oxidoreductase [Acetobacteraceae bacterium]